MEHNADAAKAAEDSAVVAAAAVRKLWRQSSSLPERRSPRAWSGQAEGQVRTAASYSSGDIASMTIVTCRTHSTEETVVTTNFIRAQSRAFTRTFHV